jgi:hypothetical protein
MTILRGAASKPRRERRRPIYTAGRAALNAHPLLGGADPRKSRRVQTRSSWGTPSFQGREARSPSESTRRSRGNICDDDA